MISKNILSPLLWFTLGCTIATTVFVNRITSVNKYLEGCNESALDYLRSEKTREARLLKYIEDGHLETAIEILREGQKMYKVEESKN